MTLHGKRIVITRATHQAHELAELLRERGAEPLLYPCIAIEPPEDTSELDAALRQLVAGQFDWLVLTSANTVEALRQRTTALGIMLKNVSTAVVGPATAQAAARVLGVTVKALPDEYVAEALATTLKPTPGMRILLPQADIARTTLCDHLTAMGTKVTAVTSYHTVIGQGGINLPGLLVADAVDAITFTSSSTVANCVQRLTNEGGDVDRLRRLVSACIGPKTAHTAKELGLTCIVMPDVYTLPTLVAALDHQLFN